MIALKQATIISPIKKQVTIQCDTFILLGGDFNSLYELEVKECSITHTESLGTFYELGMGDKHLYPAQREGCIVFVSAKPLPPFGLVDAELRKHLNSSFCLIADRDRPYGPIETALHCGTGYNSSFLDEETSRFEVHFTENIARTFLNLEEMLTDQIFYRLGAYYYDYFVKEVANVG